MHKNETTNSSIDVRSPVNKGEVAKLVVSAYNTTTGLKQIRIISGTSGNNVLINRNDTSFKFNGLDYSIKWYYKDNIETFETSFQIIDDTYIYTYTDNINKLVPFKTSTRDLTREKLMPYINGYSDRLFAPHKNLTMAEAIKLCTNLFIQPSETTLNAYSSIARYKDKWYSNIVSFAEEEGYLKILPIQDMFNPDAAISRAEFVALILSFSNQIVDGSKSDIINFIDVPKTHWAYTYINTSNQLNIVRNFGNKDKFRPNDNITRAEAVAMLNRATGRPVYKNNIDMKFEDVSIYDWFYYDVLSAVNDMNK